MLYNAPRPKSLCAICTWQKWGLGVESIKSHIISQGFMIQTKGFWLQSPLYMHKWRGRAISLCAMPSVLSGCATWIPEGKILFTGASFTGKVKASASFRGASQLSWVRFCIYLSVYCHTEDSTVLLSDNCISSCIHHTIIHYWRIGLGSV